MKNSVVPFIVARHGPGARNAFLVIMLLLISNLVMAQNRFNFELRPAANYAISDLGDAQIGPGFGFEGMVNYTFEFNVGLYAGWGWNQFTADNSFAGKDVGFEETGYSFGLRYYYPITGERFRVMVGAGGLWNHIEIENSDGEIIADSEHGFGYQVEVGFPISLGNKDRWQITPGLRYRSLDRQVKLNSIITDTNLNYLSLGLGLAFKF